MYALAGVRGLPSSNTAGGQERERGKRFVSVSVPCAGLRPSSVCGLSPHGFLDCFVRDGRVAPVLLRMDASTREKMQQDEGKYQERIAGNKLDELGGKRKRVVIVNSGE